MRFFACDDLPGLRFTAAALPAPWVLPTTVSPEHRARVVALLAAGLGRSSETVHVVRLRWSETDLLRSRRLRVAQSMLVWWDVDQEHAANPRAVIEEGAYLARGLAVYDFGGAASFSRSASPLLPATDWLRLTKMEVTYRVMDLILDRRPVPDAARLVEEVRRVARLVPSPVDVLDFADILASRVALGERLEDARAEAAASVVVSRFPASDERGSADIVVRSLAALREAQVPDELCEGVLERTGFLAQGQPTPLAGLLDHEGVVQRALTKVALVRRLSAPLRDQAPGCFSKESVVDGPAPVEPLQFQFDTEPPHRQPEEDRTAAEAPPVSVDIGSAASRLQEAFQIAAEGRLEDAVRSVLDEVRSGTDGDWSRGEAEMAAQLLDAAARKLQGCQAQSRSRGLLERTGSLFEGAGKLFVRAGKRLAAARALTEAAETFGHALRHDRARKLATRARKIADATKDPTARASAYLAVGRVLSARPKKEEGERALQAALALYCEAGDRLGEANTRKAMGDLYRRSGRAYLAEEAYEAAFPVYYELEDALGEANTRKALGDVYRATSRPREAEEAYVAALRAYRDIDDRLGEANTRKALGDLSVTIDRLGEARSAFEEALELYRALEDRLGEANVLQAIGDLRTRTNDLREAKEAYDAALPIYREFEAKLGEANTLRSIADVLAAQGSDERRVMQLYYEAGRAHASVDDPLGTGAVLGMLARLLLRSGPAHDALIASEASLRVLTAASDAYGATLSLQTAIRCFAVLDDPYGRVLSAAQLAAVAKNLRANADQPLQTVLASLDPATRAEADAMLEGGDIDGLRRETVHRAVLPRLRAAGLEQTALDDPTTILDLLCAG